MPNSELDKLFKNICVERPSSEALDAFQDFPDKDHLIRFLIGKIELLTAQIKDNPKKSYRIEWGIIYTFKLLPEYGATQAIMPLINLLDLVKTQWMAISHDSSIWALAEFGEPALEPVYAKYVEDKDIKGSGETWLEVLANLKVKDDRIRQALIDFIDIDAETAMVFMGDYRDKSLVPIIEKEIRKAADILNHKKINPYNMWDRFKERMTQLYFEGVASYIMSRDGIDSDHPDFDNRTDEIDREYLGYTDSDIPEEPLVPSIPAEDRDEPEIPENKAIEPKKKIGRNEPCPCGSGKKYKYCCGK